MENTENAHSPLFLVERVTIENRLMDVSYPNVKDFVVLGKKVTVVCSFETVGDSQKDFIQAIQNAAKVKIAVQ